MGNQEFGLSQFSETPIVTQGKMLFGQVKQAKSCLAESCLVWDMVFYSHWNIDSCLKLPGFSGFERWDNCGTRRSGWSKSWTPDSQCIPTCSNALFGLDWQFPSCKRPKILGSGRPGQVISWATWRIQSRTLAAQCCFHQCSDQWKNIETTWENPVRLDTSWYFRIPYRTGMSDLSEKVTSV